MMAPMPLADMFVDLDGDPRTEPPPLADERTTLLAFLNWQRDTLVLKCSGLDAEQLARRSVGSSTLSLLGLVRHLADGERYWFRRVMAGQDAPTHFYVDGDKDGAFDGAVADPLVVAEAWDTWRMEVAFADDFVARAETLDVTGNDAYWGAVSLRFVLMQSFEEYARHLGHVDLLRQEIDGRLGQ